MALSRFLRAKQPPPLQIQPRDLNVLLRIHEFGLMTREQIQRLEFSAATASACKRRMTLLFHNGYVGRIALPVRNAYGAVRAVYFLERLGERALIHAGRIEESADRRRRPEHPGELFLQHRLDIADVRVAFETAARQRGYTLRWWDEAALRRSGAFGARNTSDQQGLLPDGYFTLGDGTGMDGFAVEADRGTVSLGSMKRRFQLYGQFANSSANRGLLPCESFRVLTVITDPTARTRLDHLKTICESVGGRSLFWFTDSDAVHTADVLADDCWSVAGASGHRSLPLSFK